jgi:hypothetical protein
VGKRKVASSVGIDHALGRRSTLAYVGVTHGGIWNTILGAVGASFSKRQRIHVELTTHTVVGDAAISFVGGSESLWVVGVIHSQVNNVTDSLSLTVLCVSHHSLMFLVILVIHHIEDNKASCNQCE